MINFIPKEYRLDKYRIRFLVSIIIIFFLVLASFAALNLLNSNMQNTVESSKRAETEYSAKKATFDKDQQTIKSLKDQIANISSTGSQTTSAIVPVVEDNDEYYKIHTILYDLAIEAPMALKFNSIDCTPKKITIKGTSEKSEYIGAYMIGLKNKGWINLVDITKTQQMKRENNFVYYPFEITITLKGGGVDATVQEIHK